MIFVYVFDSTEKTPAVAIRRKVELLLESLSEAATLK